MNDKIELSVLWQAILHAKYIILSIVIGLTLVSWIYVLQLHPNPVLYKAQATISIGRILNGHKADETLNYMNLFDVSRDLKILINSTMDLRADVPTRSQSIIQLSYVDENVNIAKQKVKEGIEFILTRHQVIEDLYTKELYKVQKSEVVGDIKIIDVTKKSKKLLLVVTVFLMSLFLSMFSVIYFTFLRSERTKSF